MTSRFRKSFAQAGGRMAESVVSQGMKQLLTQMLETPEEAEERKLGTRYKESQIKAMESLSKQRERSVGGVIGGLPTLGNISGIYADISEEIEGRPEILIGRAKGTMVEEQIEDLKNEAFFKRLNTLLPTYKQVRAGQAPSETKGQSKPSSLSPEDEQALKWANANPNDSRAKAIKQRLGR